LNTDSESLPMTDAGSEFQTNGREFQSDRPSTEKASLLRRHRWTTCRRRAWSLLVQPQFSVFYFLFPIAATLFSAYRLSSLSTSFLSNIDRVCILPQLPTRPQQWSK